MCGISASADLDRLSRLIELNNVRGSFSFSFMAYDIENNCIESLHQSFTDNRKELIEYYKKLNKPFYYISHSQAPTSSTGLNKCFHQIHPAKYQQYYLYHNGIIKEPEKLGQNPWDTQLLLESVVSTDFKSLDEINGSFACVLVGDGIQVFRNKSCILYTDGSTISSVSDGMPELEANVVFKLDDVLVKYKTFNNKDFGFFFLE